MEDTYLVRAKNVTSYHTKPKIRWLTGLLVPVRGYDEGSFAISEHGYSIDRESVINIDTLGRCTGLKDKNGTLIFEGDILKCHIAGRNRDETFVSIVIWDSTRFELSDEKLERTFVDLHGKRTSQVGIESVLGFVMSDYHTFEIIGTIHDNPELMEV